MTNRDRQRRWQARQAAAGRKRFTVVLDRDVHQWLAAEKARSGETLSAIISRLVRRQAGRGSQKRDMPAASPPPGASERGIDEARSMIRRLLSLGGHSPDKK